MLKKENCLYKALNLRLIYFFFTGCPKSALRWDETIFFFFSKGIHDKRLGKVKN